MDSAIIVAIIGGFSAVLAATVQNLHQTKAFRRESSSQHGHLMDMVLRIKENTDDIEEDLGLLKADVESVRDELHAHIASKPDAKSTTTRRKGSSAKNLA